jgi:hypothetical protein
VAALRAVSRTVPIVFAHAVDPVGAGFVDSLARPGGNITGFVLFEYSIFHRCEMAGTTQRDHAWHHAGGDPSRSHHCRWDGPVRCHPIRGTVVQSGGQSTKLARRRRDRTRYRGPGERCWVNARSETGFATARRHNHRNGGAQKRLGGKL